MTEKRPYVYVVEQHSHSGYLSGGVYQNTFEHKVVAVYLSRPLAQKHAARRGHSMKRFPLSEAVPPAKGSQT